MNSLTSSILILAGLVLIGVVAYNWFQGRNSAKSPREALRRSEQEPLLEPTTLPMEAAKVSTPKSSVSLTADEPSLHAPNTVAAKGHFALDERLDVIVTSELPEPIAGERLIAATANIRRAGTKPVLVEAIAVGQDDSEHQTWGPLSPGRHFQAIRLGALLSNRMGPLNGIEYSEFINALQPLCEQFDINFDPPAMSDVLQRARELDEACADLDAQVGLNVETAQSLSPVQLEAFALRQGFVEKGNTRFVAPGEGTEPLFVVTLSQQANRINFSLDVPRVAERFTPWAKLVDSALLCAEQLKGQVVDDEGRPLSADSLRRVGEQLGSRYQELHRAGFEAGSDSARRTFT